MKYALTVAPIEQPVILTVIQLYIHLTEPAQNDPCWTAD